MNGYTPLCSSPFSNGPGHRYHSHPPSPTTTCQHHPVLTYRIMHVTHHHHHHHLPLIFSSPRLQVDDAVEQAKQGQIPPLHWLWRNMYAEPLGAGMRGVLPAEYHVPAFDPTYKS